MTGTGRRSPRGQGCRQTSRPSARSGPDEQRPVRALFQALGCEGNAYTAAWPEFDLAESIEDTVQIVVQVLGKVRGRVDVPRDASNEEMQAAAETAVAKWLEGKTVVKAICVPGKLVNLVVK